MKFAHLADCHIGGWRDPKMRDLNINSFVEAIRRSVDKNVDFILISGDLFNTSLPSIDKLKVVTEKLKELKDRTIAVYIIPGSHDFSPSGRTMLDVLEKADLLVKVVKGTAVDGKLKLKFTVDAKTGAKITGMLGKAGMLEKTYYESLDKESLEKEDGFKIFMFHTALTEFKPRDMQKMDSSPLSLLPKNFDYYAGGHVHYVFQKEEPGFGTIVYPGPLFPNNFSEIEKLGCGGFYFYNDGKLEYEKIELVKHFPVVVECNHKSASQVHMEIMKEIKDKTFENTLVTIKLSGTLESGKPSELDFREIFSTLNANGAYFVMKNTNALSMKELDSVKIDSASTEDIEHSLIKEHINKIDMPLETEEQKVVTDLMNVMGMEKDEGEKNADFEKRLKEDVSKLLDLKL